MHRPAVLACLLLCLVYAVCWSRVNAQVTECTNERRQNELQFLFMASAGSAFNTFSSSLGMKIALERINENSSVLSNYTLNYSAIVDSQCIRTPSLSGFINQINSPCRNFLAVIGSGCSVATEPVAELGSYWGLSHVSFGSSAINLRNRNMFRNYFQLYPSEDNYVPAFANIIEYYGWRQVAVVTQKENLFTETELELRGLLEMSGIEILQSTQFESFEDPVTVPNIFPENARVFFLNMYENKARQVICHAYHQNLRGQNYCWIMYGWYDDMWWTKPSENGSSSFVCTAEQLYSVVNRAIAVQQYPVNEFVNRTVIGNLSYTEFQNLYSKEVNLTTFTPTYVAHIAYDATWTLALALDKAIERIKYNDTQGTNCTGNLTSLNDWDYSISASSCLIREALGDTSFEGLTGNVVFDANGIRLNSPVRIYQYRNGELVRIAKWRRSHFNFTYINQEENNETVFPNGIPPDGTPARIISTFHISLVVIFYVLSLVGLIFCVVCFVFTTFFRNRKVVRLTSPNLNYFIIAGTAMVFVSIFFRTAPLDTNDEENYRMLRNAFCNLTLFLDFLGYTLAFGTILSKMWRIYYIFHNPSPNKKILTDIHLAVMILLIAFGMAIVLTLGFAIPQTRPNVTIGMDQENSNRYDGRNIRQLYFLYKCFADSSIVWLIFLYVYLGALQVIALILAIQTRKVRIKILNDSKEVAAIIYITSIVLVELVIVSFSLSSFNNLHEVLYSGGLFVAAIVILIIIFIPKMLRLYRDPEGESIDQSQAFSAIEVGKSGALTVVTDKERIVILESQIQVLKSQLGNKESPNRSRRNGKAESVTFVETSMDNSLDSDGHHDSNVDRKNSAPNVIMTEEPGKSSSISPTNDNIT